MPTWRSPYASPPDSNQTPPTNSARFKTAITATYKAVRKKHLVCTLAEFELRFNHRESLAAMIPLLAATPGRAKPVTYSTLKWADYGA